MWISSTIEFFNHPFFILFGGVATLIIVLGVVLKIVCSFLGITPIVVRLGIALWRRKISIFSSNEVYQSLRATLEESGIFKPRNILHIREDNIDRANTGTLFLVDWQTFGGHIDRVFSARKNDQTAIVIYAKPASIPQEQMNDIANRANTVVVNFRGRLLNDILTSLVTTSYDA